MVGKIKENGGENREEWLGKLRRMVGKIKENNRENQDRENHVNERKS